ncbi:MAG: riboflavin synthase [Porticoccaceae bacterium]|nr:riboflavin synthase [Porticoccaceae bacterium]
MFTGIVEAKGQIARTEPKDGDLRLTVNTGELPAAELRLGDSVAVNGVCLTVVDLPGDGFVADVSRETLAMTTAGQWQTGTHVNLERALLPESRLGGHIVSGHVDGIGQVLSRISDARSERFRVRVPDPLARYIAHKGSVTIDGVSLTVNKVEGAEFEINIVPHTREVTVIGGYQAGTRVNIEVDVIARYLERLLLGDKAAEA